MGINIKTALLAMISLAFASVLPAAEQRKFDLPDAASQAKAEALIREIYKGEYAKNAPQDRRAFAKTLLAQGRDVKTDPAARFVLLRESRNIAASAGDIGGGMKAVEELYKLFPIDLGEQKIIVLLAASKTLDNPYDTYSYLSTALAILDQLGAARDYAGANKLSPSIAAAAEKTRSRFIINGARSRIALVKDSQTEFERLKSAMNRPPASDPNGDLSAGKFACFFDGDWQHGLGRLSKCSDAGIRDAAAGDLANPRGGLARFAVANAWWEVAQKQTGLTRLKFEARARQWYRAAIGDIGGLEKALAEKHIATSLGAPEEAEIFDGHAYTFTVGTVGWHQARLACELVGGHLACIESKEEWEFVYKLANGQTSWLGGSDEAEEGNWRWVNGSPWTFAAWQANQPDNHQGIQHYLIFNIHGWDDDGKAGLCNVICEWE